MPLLRAILPSLLLLAGVVGCDGRVYHMTIRAPGENPGMVRERVAGLAVEAAASHGMVPAPPEHAASVRPRPIVAYWVEEPPAWGSAWIGLRVSEPNPGVLRVSVLTFPAFDYPIAEQLRTDLNRRVRERFGEDAVRGF